MRLRLRYFFRFLMKQKLSKTEIIDLVYNNTPNIQLKQVDLIVNSFLRILSEKLKEGCSIEMRGFGSFDLLPPIARQIKENAEKKYRVKFKAGKDLRENLPKIKPESAANCNKNGADTDEKS